MKRTLIGLLATSAAFLALAEARAADGATSADPAAQRLVSRYAEFAGSPDNAASLVAGLRSGTAVTLGDGSVVTTFSPPTGRMGWGNVQRALDLARADLAAQGIANPTPEQLQAALVGSATTPGILQLRSAGSGWGQIAQQRNVSPSGRIDAPLAGSSRVNVRTRGAIVTAAGTSATGTPAVGMRGGRTQAGTAHSSVAKGIVTGGGRLAGSTGQTGGGRANGHRAR